MLWIGFGGLVALLIVIGVYALSVVRQVQVRNEKIRSDYLERAALLEQLRSETYLSGTYVRDFLLETDEHKAALDRREFLDARRRVETSIQRYAQIVRPEEVGAFDSLARGLHGYFDALQPALEWNVAESEALGRSFMREQVQRRRLTMLDLADAVSEVNQRQMKSGDVEIREMFFTFRRRLLFVLTLTLLVGVVLASVSMQRIFTLEQQASARYREAQDLSAKLVDAQEGERRSIARELHDEVGQSLSALLLAIGNLAKLLAPAGPAVTGQLDTIRSLAEKSVSVVRNMSLLLRPSMLDDLGLVPALQWQARETARHTGMRVTVMAEGIPETLPDQYKTAVYRIVQEALHNCQKHSRATLVQIRLVAGDGRLTVSVQDDGQGFRPENRGLGLLGIEERVKRLGGNLSIRSEHDSGTLLIADLPGTL